MAGVSHLWEPDSGLLRDIESMARDYRRRAEEHLKPIVSSYYPALLDGGGEYRKMIELSTKMTMVGHACTEIGGYRFDERRRRMSALFGACCFIGDSFIDDFGDDAAREYIERYELLLTKGWFDIRNDRERLFFVILTRLFGERDVLDPMLRQAIFSLFLAQKRDVDLRLDPGWLKVLRRRSRLDQLRVCARDRSGHAITVLSLFLVPGFPLRYHHLLYTAGALIMYIDDHGDCYSDLYHNRVTYMNQVKNPSATLLRAFARGTERLRKGLPEGRGREILLAFLYRYFITRIEKHRLERDRGRYSWTVYE